MEILFQRGPHPDKIPVLHDDLGDLIVSSEVKSFAYM